MVEAIEVLHEECKKMKSIRTKSSMMESSMIKRLTDIKGTLCRIMFSTLLLLLLHQHFLKENGQRISS